MRATDGAAPEDPPERPRRTILHVDMDAFFVSVELLRRPELQGKPVVVGGNGARGVVAAASYEARRFGVHSAMSSVRARRLCPDAVFLHGDHARYAEVSREVHRVLHTFSPLVEGIGLDEAFLDVSGARRSIGPAQRIGARLRQQVAEETGLICSVGVAPTKLLAKLASEAAKPRASAAGIEPGAGVVVVDPADALRFLHAHPVQALWGVGPATLERLRRLGVTTVADLAALREAALVSVLGTSAGRHLSALAHGVDDRPVVADRAVKSVGHEETFAEDRHHHDELHVDLVRLSDGVGARLRAAGLAARTVTVKVRFGTFRTITRSATLAEPIATGPGLAKVATELLAGVDVTAGIRLLGVSGSGLTTQPARQLTLDETPAPEWGQASAAVDQIRARFGPAAIGPATLTRPRRHGVDVLTPGARQWGPSSPDEASDNPHEQP